MVHGSCQKNQNKVPKVENENDDSKGIKGRSTVSGDRRRRCLSDIIHIFQKKFFPQKIYKLSTHVVFLAYEFSRITGYGSN